MTIAVDLGRKGTKQTLGLTDADCAGRLQQSVLGSIRLECDADCAGRLQQYACVWQHCTGEYWKCAARVTICSKYVVAHYIAMQYACVIC